MAKKHVYLFTEGKGSMKELLGGKGANLAEMTNLGMPVPQGFTVSTEACTRYYDDGETIAPEIEEEIQNYIKEMEKITQKTFGDIDNPLLVSVRSGARASMPGMMDTILNLGLNDEVVVGLAKLTKNERFAYDSYRRFIQMFSDVVMEVPKSSFEHLIDAAKSKKGVKFDSELDSNDMKELVSAFKNHFKENKGFDFPTDPKSQLMEAIKAVFKSWNNPRANVYRRLNDIPSSWGTAVNVQAMVFGNMGETSGTGVAFTRNPATGEKKLYGEFLMNAQGEDVVAGIRTPQTIDQLKQVMPDAYNQFTEIADKLEDHYSDMQDMEFTIENKKLYMLQTRNGKRTAAAALKIAVDLVDEGVLAPKEAIMKVEPKQLDALLHPQFDPSALKSAAVAGKGLNASPGAACGKVYFNAADACMAVNDRGEKAILVRLETSPEDIEGMQAAEGILTVRGGNTSHAAVVARGMGTCCVCGCGDIEIHEEGKYFMLHGEKVSEGDYISLDGSTGNIYIGKLPTVESGISGNFERFMAWADEYRTLKIRTNADTPFDAAKAIEFGAEGIGLTRTEHMFFEPDRIPAIREMIVAKSLGQRKIALDKLLPMQRGDFEGIFAAMGDRPVTIRLLDPPLHEFLPNKDENVEPLAKEMKMGVAELQAVIESLHEINPMMGHRGCRLAVSYPEIAEMQTRAIIEAAINVKKFTGVEIMIPLICDLAELKFVKKIIVETADKIIKDSGAALKYQVGTMIEIPRAALTADEIATEAEFFSFGTNDLTQMTYGLSRDDSGKILDDYFKAKIFESDPTTKLDYSGVGKLIKIAVELGKKTRPDIKLGICGEHGGEPSSITFCHNAGLAYVSCSPYRVPIAKLAAAQAAVNSSSMGDKK
ncbi:MAG: pyruvate, phosphate dikinase [Oscillospiraceae bacterium]|nr:pyruvate, phosphate dikinase [Oscillospiraceae bacterium]